MIAFIFLVLALILLLCIAWRLADEVERLGQVAEKDEGEWL